MKSHRILLAGLLLVSGFGTLDAMAQPEGRKKGQVVRPGEREREGRPGRNRGRRARSADAQLERLSEALKLDETQKNEIGALLKAHEGKMREIRDSFRPTEEEKAEMDSLREDMRAARETDDKEKMAECRERMRAARDARTKRMEPARDAIETAESNLHDAILPKLNEDQLKAFEEIWQEVMAPRGGARRGGKYDPRLLQRAVSRAKGLSAEQETAIEALFAEFRENERSSRKDRAKKPGNSDEKETGKNGRRSRRRAQDDTQTKKLYDDVMAVLTEEQRKEVESTLKRTRGRGKDRGKRGDADSRGAPGRFGERPDRPKTPIDDD